jgi:predicted nucleic acid-binding Zn ribbon protein
MKKVDKNIKYCPRCGTPNDIKNRYCIKCGYDFYENQKKKLKLKQILLIILVLFVMWVFVRLITNKPIIPEILQSLFPKLNSSNLTIFQNLSKNKSLNMKFLNLSR